MLVGNKLIWTPHAEWKMKFYGLSRQRVLGVIRNPERVEAGVLPGAVAVMRPVSVKVIAGKRVWRQEIWTMYLPKAKGIHSGTRGAMRIVSAWRYPGMSRGRATIPEDVLSEARAILAG